MSDSSEDALFSEDYVPPEDRETYYFVCFRTGEYLAWNDREFKSERREYKDHIITVDVDAETNDPVTTPRTLCSHLNYSRGMDVEPIEQALSSGETTKGGICGHCLERLPPEVYSELFQ